MAKYITVQVTLTWYSFRAQILYQHLSLACYISYEVATAGSGDLAMVNAPR